VNNDEYKPPVIGLHSHARHGPPSTHIASDVATLKPMENWKILPMPKLLNRSSQIL